MDIRLFDKFIANKCTSAEIEKVFSWLQEQPEMLSEKKLFKNYWDKIEPADDENSDQARQRLDRIHHTINLHRSEHLDTGNIRFLTGPKASVIRLLSRAAVILLIPVITLLVYTSLFQSGHFASHNKRQKIEILSPPGSRTHLELADGTKVWLNHSSKLVYPERFTGKTRTVQLIGEAYFEVAPDKAKPFIVESDGMALKAVGTTFNVRAYPEDPDYEATLETGKVFILKNTPGKQATFFHMEPGQHFVLNRATNRHSLKTEELTKYVSWKEGKLIFKDDHMDAVAEQLSRWFSVKISLSDPGLRELTYTATFVDEPLSQILEMMEVVMPISCTVSEREKMPDGTYSKKEILIYQKKGRSS